MLGTRNILWNLPIFKTSLHLSSLPNDEALQSSSGIATHSISPQVQVRCHGYTRNFALHFVLLSCVDWLQVRPLHRPHSGEAGERCLYELFGLRSSKRSG